MILNSLCDYYDLLCQVEDSDISPFGFQKIPASYAATLSAAGDLLDIVSLKELNDNRPQEFLIPKSMKKPGIFASPVCDNFEYVFGIGGDKGEKTTEKKKFETARSLHLQLFDQAKTPEAMAIRSFFEKWEIEKAWENEHVLKHYSEKGKAFSGNVVFRLENGKDYFHQNPEIIEIWKSENEKMLASDGVETAQCSVTGKVTQIARLHEKFSGVKGAIATKASLVSFNKDADVSYGLSQSRNSAVSEEVAFKYYTALQHLLSDHRRKIQIGDATTVFWAEKLDCAYTDIFKFMLNNPDEMEEEGINEDLETVEKVKSILKDGSQGIYNDVGLDLNTKFYILGLSPNAGRLSVRFFYRDSFGNFCDQIKQHYDDMNIYGGSNGKEHISLWSLLNATISSESKEKKINPLLGGAVARSIFTGDQYPQILFNQTIIRVKTEAQLTQPRAAIIKGCLTRKNRIQNKTEELGMYLDEKSTKPAYVLGRTFAVLEMIQKKALGNEINTTIKDKYFASACSNPSLVFPNLLKLAQHHLTKIEKKEGIESKKYWEIQLGKIISLLESDSFPKVVDMDNQGRFILGYYQQTQKNYEKREVKEEAQNGEC
ncbi:type I-C CRISPR-associated protein Cas8c/Csd1 [Acetobacterium wieringae]|uniref:Type I-C CRISPR-associated protein Cas8c/Csd1 n=1 Tax=Acetobacterium wieringae TaxID=52694 RepID=A0A5D0WXA7_9FIRM|nr:type I-C CRISPR-associated protein Cas8c/Csd1 [Acetobacterium wieringae]TYC88271.1 type I-C CRISPR-associated protein Cas8c/Csd1 [Acetobacterium wieringae]